MHIYIDTVKKSRTARSDKNTNSCPKTFNETLTQLLTVVSASKTEELIKLPYGLLERCVGWDPGPQGKEHFWVVILGQV